MFRLGTSNIRLGSSINFDSIGFARVGWPVTVSKRARLKPEYGSVRAIASRSFAISTVLNAAARSRGPRAVWARRY